MLLKRILQLSPFSVLGLQSVLADQLCSMAHIPLWRSWTGISPQKNNLSSLYRSVGTPGCELGHGHTATGYSETGFVHMPTHGTWAPVTTRSGSCALWKGQALRSSSFTFSSFMSLELPFRLPHHLTGLGHHLDYDRVAHCELVCHWAGRATGCKIHPQSSPPLEETFRLWKLEGRLPETSSW